MEGGAELGGVKCGTLSEILATPIFGSAKKKKKNSVHTRGMHMEVLRMGWVFFFFFISTVINKENNKSVL